jgi:hypothetical protein
VERIRVDFSGPHLAHLRAVLDTTPGSKDALPADARTHRSESETEEVRVPEPVAPDDDIEADLELAADREVGLTEEQILAEQERAGAGKRGGGRDAA